MSLFCWVHESISSEETAAVRRAFRVSIEFFLCTRRNDLSGMIPGNLAIGNCRSSKKNSPAFPRKAIEEARLELSERVGFSAYSAVFFARNGLRRCKVAFAVGALS